MRLTQPNQFDRLPSVGEKKLKFDARAFEQFHFAITAMHWNSIRVARTNHFALILTSTKSVIQLNGFKQK